MTRIPHNVLRTLREPWQVHEPALDAFFALCSADLAIDVDDAFANPADEDYELPFPVIDGEAQISFSGVVGKGLEWWEKYWYGMLDLNDFNRHLALAEESADVESIRVLFNSPGGSVIGMIETMEHYASVSKPTTSYTEDLCASAAYFVASQGDTVVATESSILGSLGTFTRHIDWSGYHKDSGIQPEVIKNKQGKYKAAGVMGLALTSEQRAQKQETVQWMHDRCLGMVQAKRPDLMDEYAQGQVVYGGQAFLSGSGLIDDLVTLSY